ncbi:hypothetical protein VNI00_006800 [Paramarasmius palmivorus]|uniref:F-box domain-containing protein n=1 Tax=Paramarasmius palmivorus TaxID=297713 RepID=A0AAW0D7X7_9AGAR
MASQNTNSSDSSCCRTCRADVEMSKNTIHGPPDDLYAHLTRVNGYPDDSSPFKEEFNVAKSRLKQLSATIALLEAERSRLVGIVEKYKVILHPIRTAPVDVLRHIFDLCVDRTDGHVDLPPEFQNSLVPSRMPWVLGQICRGWRSFALSTPQLWTGVSLDIRQVEAISQESMTADVHRLGLQLHRSQNLPLIVSISSEKVKLQHNTASGPLHITSEVLLNIHPMLVLLCAFSERWKHLQLKGKSQGVQRVFSTRGLLPRLECLIMDLDETPNQASDLATCFEFAPG